MAAIEEGKIIRELSEQIILAQKPIRILDAIKWNGHIQQEFFKNNFKKLPSVDKDYYQHNPLSFIPEETKNQFYEIENNIKKRLGNYHPIGNIMIRMSREYRETVRMLEARGSKEFTLLAQRLYGTSNDAFYPGAPTLSDLALVLNEALTNIKNSAQSSLDEKIYSSEEAVQILSKNLANYFQKEVKVELSDGIFADAAAGADRLKIRRDAKFSPRDLKMLEVHEGWVHIGTTLNGLEQPYCTFLSKGPPSSTVTQEGLAIIMEIFTFASYPERVARITQRVQGIHLAEQGADFLDVFNYYREQGITAEQSYANTVRIFRGSLPNAGPFTKDLSYSKGFILIYNYIRLAIKNGLLDRIPLLFLGKTSLEDIKVYSHLTNSNLIVLPHHIPPQFNDLSGLSAWMCYSLFLNKLSLEKLQEDYKDIL